ncbi:DUF2487 family protein [Paenibacillus mucilaginosus]|uniref:DUF2487 family protein n=1 Tax=Paenibacillus mucilaginosus (strain KNP414) TaxID=1036673 RepID=F8FAW6_PAEMK|nr:DUF2487 family protein [Paenibacillus mucilaginosus]AEI41367.1 hypothetical protein KNP414_02807 [Paenibacillus mucilaginosus KNP414]MCG7211214.1 YpiF family protein [Paenibacillus mucilaginosus]WDM30392.1 DUF2487 family protein [Paenibacillus mucilaginosus]
MKFSEINEGQWEELRPYLDTCLLPVTGLSGAESPWKAARELEHLRDALDLLEIPFKGRTVTYPALHFTPAGDTETIRSLLLQVCSGLRSEGFRYVVLVTAQPEEAISTEVLEAGGADRILRVTPQQLQQAGAEAKREAAGLMTGLWNPAQSL